MNSQMNVEAQLEMSTSSEFALNETDMLAGWGFTRQEFASLLWLRQWNQSGGGDRANLLHHLEFLRLLVQSGELEL